jgi:hypothetical protein|tara:strand:- start:320 stop:493 length:174 start_codon:yes stop_codon:yes gene_type:complete
MKKTFTGNSNVDIEELRKLDEKSKNGKCSSDDHLRITAYRFALRLIPDEVYWQEVSV